MKLTEGWFCRDGGETVGVIFYPSPTMDRYGLWDTCETDVDWDYWDYEMFVSRYGKSNLPPKGTKVLVDMEL